MRMTPKAFPVWKILATACLIALLLCAIHDALADETLTLATVQARGGLNVRSAPDPGADAVYLLDDCETVIVLARMDGWALVAKNNGEHTALGWVCGDYLR